MQFFIDSQIDRLKGDALRAALLVLPSWRREQALRYRHESQQAQSAASYLLLCKALREVYGIEEQPAFEYNEYGKPLLRLTTYERPISFNMSHCRTAVAVALNERPVGIDIECRGRYTRRLAEYVLSPAELEKLGEEPDRHFTHLWTQKEAVVKLLGTGLTNGESIRSLLETPHYDFHTEETKDYVCTVAQYRTDLFSPTLS